MYKWVLVVGLVVLAATGLILYNAKKKQNTGYDKGIKAANTSKIRATKLYKTLSMQYKVFTVLIISGLLGGIISALVLTARPYRNDDIMSGVKKRDIMLCLDVSYSLYDLNSEITDYWKGVVKGFRNPRIKKDAFLH